MRSSRLLMVALLGGCAAHPDTAPRNARGTRIGSWALRSDQDVCDVLISHVKATGADDGPLSCRALRLESAPSPDLPMTLVQVVGARTPRVYLVHRPAEGGRRVLAEYLGERGMTFSASVSPSETWIGEGRLVRVTTRWRSGRRGTTSLTLCLADPRYNNMNFPVCAFTSVIERWRVIGNDWTPQPHRSVPSSPPMEWWGWAVAIEHTYGVALVAQVRGKRDASVPTGAFLIQPPLW